MGQLKVVINGSRDWADRTILELFISGLPKGTTVIHGAARGADALAGEIASQLGLEVLSEPADWRPNGVYDQRAGKVRNTRMLEKYKPDLVVSFKTNWNRDLDRGGTEDLILKAKARRIPVYVVEAPND